MLSAISNGIDALGGDTTQHIKFHKGEGHSLSPNTCETKTEHSRSVQLITVASFKKIKKITVAVRITRIAVHS